MLRTHRFDNGFNQVQILIVFNDLYSIINYVVTMQLLLLLLLIDRLILYVLPVDWLHSLLFSAVRCGSGFASWLGFLNLILKGILEGFMTFVHRRWCFWDYAIGTTCLFDVIPTTTFSEFNYNLWIACFLRSYP